MRSLPPRCCVAGDVAGTRPCPSPAASIPLRPGALGGKTSTICCFIIKRGVYKSKPICCQTNRQIAALLRQQRLARRCFPPPPRLLDAIDSKAGLVLKNNESQAPRTAVLAPGRSDRADHLPPPTQRQPPVFLAKMNFRSVVVPPSLDLGRRCLAQPPSS